ncbi:hypothetical protein A2333_01240 [Candidatus Wolfebacteria bacterium RIFOXYB2_FULL_49_7]|uniref:Uncharacterized protein n=1 Tax=Candidatus Wolfebacteria bacterium RIFOXYB1_FULL_54_12 TaxID=1802559 RepID=A0A1F8DVY5_9BACT|nr:MAG: hypothetical protein A2372_00935 [Candidatus Wolfebacteria bacterium RIFOXYB1_FULL_54_12]OGM94728.1 MAG: hypothetical protein A2524_02450 [Candidatus Wolfebacteria bacterium RIFOXYD12_FULL_48_21]OGM95714.1 MAG: hypothetical protein A2532_03660 [Candidatus Wolfebacteria bacterium RIFOXYD2_FULL_48_11]OGM96479.1 MAG: hypothetical protein A2333_01240 [Candidatus Wolfebacteria bacterium RIFOXYB2_FULL_49_7]
MKNYFGKNRKLIFAILIATVLWSVGNFYLRSKFHSGECVRALDGYTWHINNYRFGKYFLMGWQGNAWGNEVKMDKDILEREDISGIIAYHQVVCPEYNPNNN